MSKKEIGDESVEEQIDFDKIDEELFDGLESTKS